MLIAAKKPADDVALAEDRLDLFYNFQFVGTITFVKKRRIIIYCLTNSKRKTNHFFMFRFCSQSHEIIHRH